MIEKLLRPEVQDLLVRFQDADPADIALRLGGENPGFPVKLIADQIRSRQKAKSKLPEWHACPEVIFPMGPALEQSSSQVAAKVKSQLLTGETLVDLTGGAGVDAYYFSKSFGSVTYVERQEPLAQLATHNFARLGATNITVLNQDALSFIAQVAPGSTIYLDPSRRQGSNRVRNLEEYEPNVVKILDQLFDKAQTIMIKASPLLDITAALRSLKKVQTVYVVGIRNDCKEVLYLLSSQANEPVGIETINVPSQGSAQRFSYLLGQENTARPVFGPVQKYLFEPNSSVLKAGAFKILGSKFNLTKLHPNTHLFTADKVAVGFPGRVFEVEEVLDFKPRKLRKLLSISQANISSRNFPLTPDQLRSQLGLADGGQNYLFGTRTVQDKLVVILCKKQGNR